MRRALAYFGLDGFVPRQEWVHATVEAAPPLVMATVVARFAPWLRK